MSSQEQVEISVSPRNTGKHWSRKLRREQMIPAVVYGPKVKNMNFAIPELDADRYSKLHYENTIFVLKSDDAELNNMKVLKKQIVRNPLTRRPEHLDFYALDMTQTVKVNVEIRYEGKSEGEREGGVFNAVRKDVEVECLPIEIPDFFVVDISELQLNQTMHVSDLKLPDSVKLLTDLERTICTVAEVKEEEEAPAVEAAVDGEGAAAAPADGEAAPAATTEGQKKDS